jgi:hypothetical protein
MDAADVSPSCHLGTTEVAYSGFGLKEDSDEHRNYRRMQSAVSSMRSSQGFEHGLDDIGYLTPGWE